MEPWILNPAELQPHELMRIVTEFFESHGVPYVVAGSVASMADVDETDTWPSGSAQTTILATPSF